MSFEEIKELYSSAFNIFYDSFISMFSIVVDYLPGFMPYIAIIVATKLIPYIYKSKIRSDYDGPVFDDDYGEDFDLAYDSLRRMYDSDADFINDYMSDFTAFQDDEPDIDELVESDMWEDITYDRYINSDDDIYYYNELAFVDNFDDDYTYIHLPYSFETYEGSYSDYVEAEEAD